MRTSTKSTTTLTANEILGNELARIRSAKKELQLKFKADLQKVWDDYRAAKKQLVAERKNAWKSFDDAKAERKAAKVEAKKAAAKKVTKKATKKPAKKVAKKTVDAE